MTVKITKQVMHLVRCDQCGFSESSTDEATVRSAAIQHEGRHTTSVVIGATLGGKVFWPKEDPNMFWTLGSAIDAARAAGFPFLEWNGHIYTTLGTDEPVCWARDVVRGHNRESV